jgi:hypothetical protein
MRVTRKKTLWLLAGYTLACAGAYGETAPSDEVAVKAGFLYNFAQFVDWPPFPTGKVFEFCAVGDPSMSEYLRVHLTGKSVGGLPAAVRMPDSASAMSTCTMLYIGRGEKKNAAKFAQALEGRPILVVSEFPGLGSKGVAINFYLEEQRVRFEVNLGPVTKAGLKIRARLLNLARVVGDK